MAEKLTKGFIGRNYPCPATTTGNGPVPEGLKNHTSSIVPASTLGILTSSLVKLVMTGEGEKPWIGRRTAGQMMSMSTLRHVLTTGLRTAACYLLRVPTPDRRSSLLADYLSAKNRGWTWAHQNAACGDQLRPCSSCEFWK